MHFHHASGCVVTRPKCLPIVLAQQFEELEAVRKTHAVSIIAGTIVNL